MCEINTEKINMRLLCFYCLMPFSLSSCVTSSTTSFGISALPASFTTENTLKVHQGMSSGEILALFGTPKSVRSAVCGGSTDATWTCTTWKYGDFPYDNASFTFSGNHGSYKLNNFDIDRD